MISRLPIAIQRLFIGRAGSLWPHCPKLLRSTQKGLLEIVKSKCPMLLERAIMQFKQELELDILVRHSCNQMSLVGNLGNQFFVLVVRTNGDFERIVMR